MRTTIIFLFLLPLVLTGCLKPIPYEPDQLDLFSRRPENRWLQFHTEKGRQVAFYIPPLESPDKPPTKIAIFYPGIESLALGWLQFIDLNKDPKLAYLLIDYPGRGLSEGMVRPKESYRNTEGALTALANHWGQEWLDAELNLMGHSFGTGAALQFAVRHSVKRIVLVAPFNSLRQAAAEKSKILSLLMPDQIDNRALIRTLLATKLPPEITIFHGVLDVSLPVSMGRELAALDPHRIVFHEFPEDGHSNILKRQWNSIFKAIDGLAN